MAWCRMPWRRFFIVWYCLAAILLQAGPILFPIPGPSAGAVRLRAAYRALQEGKLDEAQADFDESMRLDPGRFETLTGLAELARQRRQPAQVEAWLKKALELDSRNPLVYRAWAHYLAGVNRVDEAETALRKAAALAPREHEALLELGDTDLAAGRMDNAAQAYRDALLRKPDSYDAHLGLASALSGAKRFAAAVPEFRQAAGLMPSRPEPWLSLGLVYGAAGDRDKAIAALSAALKIDPRFAQAWISRGDAWQAKGDSVKALADYSEALKIDPNNGVVEFKIGLVHLAANRVPEAEGAFRAAVEKDPGLADGWNDLAWLAADSKVNLGMALIWAKKAVSLSPREPRFADTLAWVYRARGDLDLAARTLENFRRRDGNPALLYHLGVIDSERGRKTEAMAALRQSLASGSFAEAGQARRLLASLKP